MHLRPPIGALIEGELSPWRERRARQHVRRCAQCRRDYDQELRVRRLLSGDVSRPTALEQRLARRRVVQALPLPDPSASDGQTIRTKLRPLWQLAAVATLATALLIGLIFATLRMHSPAPLPVAVLRHQRGVRVDGSPADKDQPVFNGQRVEVRLGGLAELRLTRGGELRVFPDSSLAIDRGGDRIRLDRGAVWSQIEAQQRSFEVRTPEASAQVLGTSFVVEHRHGRTQVRVMRGQVRVRDRRHLGQVTLSSQQQSSVIGGSAPSAARRYDPQRDRQAWRRILQDLLRAIEHGVKQGLKAIGDTLRSLGREMDAP